MADVALIACSQADVLGEACPSCGGWIHSTVPGGIATGHLVVCSPECAADEAELARRRHLDVRELLCACADACAPAGLPSPVDREIAAELARHDGPIPAADFDRMARERGWR